MWDIIDVEIVIKLEKRFCNLALFPTLESLHGSLLEEMRILKGRFDNSRIRKKYSHKILFIASL